jgi:hypothetical protein
VRRLVAVVSLVLSSVLVAGTAAADGCALCLDSIALQTRDGQPWSAGKPVTLVVRVTGAGSVSPPPTALAVVMQTDGDRTKCLEVPLKLVEGSAAHGLYAGLFFPFRPARYDGKLAIGDDVQDITFDVRRLAAGAAPAGELPAAAPIDTSAPAPAPAPAVDLPLVGAAALVLGPLAALGLRARRRRPPQPT